MMTFLPAAQQCQCTGGDLQVYISELSDVLSCAEASLIHVISNCELWVTLCHLGVSC